MSVERNAVHQGMQNDSTESIRPTLLGERNDGEKSSADKKVIHRLPYAVELECKEADTRHWMHPWCLDANGGALALRPPILPKDAPTTIPNCFNLAAEKYGKQHCMGTRPLEECTFEGKKQYWKKGAYEWKTFEEVHGDVTAAAKGLLRLPEVQRKREAKEQCVAAVLADTSAEWQISAQAALQCGITLTTIYTTLGREAMLHGLRETEACVIFIDWAQYHALSDVISQCPSLKHIIVIGRSLVPQKMTGSEIDLVAFPSSEEAQKLPNVGSADTSTLDGIIAAGSSSTVDLASFAPEPEDTAFIMYTSGSTGLPKGVVLSHTNFVSVIASALAQGVVTPRSAEDVYVAYLPLAHILELVVETATICQGAAVGYAHPRTLTSSSPYIHPENPQGSDLLALRPTLMAAVPAILDLIKTGLNAKIQKMPGLKGKLVAGAINKAQGLPRGNVPSSLLSCCAVDRVLLKKVRQGLGLERVRLIISGGAPLSPETQEFITAILAPVAQGYGATETGGCATVQEVVSSGGRPADQSCGHVGAIQPASEIKLLSVPEMGYLVSDPQPRGEILVSGNNVTQTGYYKMEEQSAKDFPTHPDGKIWFHTGDVGMMTETGVLKIIDRKKDLIKLSGGEYVSLGKVEAALKQVPGIGACVVFARPDKDHCVVIVSQPERGWEVFGGKPDEESLTKAIEKKLREMGLAKFEIPAKAAVDDIVWTPETGLVTASLKVQRNPLRNHYNKVGGLLEKMDYKFPDV